MDDDVFSGFGVPVILPHNRTDEEYATLSFEQRKEANKDSFLKIRETLTRIGVASRKEKNLYQSAHLLHKRGEYAILHFKELFAIDGKPTNIDSEDIARRNRIVKLLEEWGLLSVITPIDPTRLRRCQASRSLSTTRSTYGISKRSIVSVRRRLNRASCAVLSGCNDT